MTEEIYVIDETFIIEKFNIDEIYEKSIEWLKSEGSKITKEEKPWHIRARHIGWKYRSAYMTKYIVLTFKQQPMDVIVNFKIPHIPSVSPGGGYWTQWWPIIWNYCVYVGIDKTQAEVKIRALVEREGKIIINPF
jgi:hypothetical protein